MSINSFLKYFKCLSCIAMSKLININISKCGIKIKMVSIIIINYLKQFIFLEIIN